MLDDAFLKKGGAVEKRDPHLGVGISELDGNVTLQLVLETNGL